VTELKELSFLQGDIIQTLRAKIHKYDGDKARVLPVDASCYCEELNCLIDRN
jgi:hypothetical protein